MGEVNKVSGGNGLLSLSAMPMFCHIRTISVIFRIICLFLSYVHRGRGVKVSRTMLLGPDEPSASGSNW